MTKKEPKRDEKGRFVSKYGSPEVALIAKFLELFDELNEMDYRTKHRIMNRLLMELFKGEVFPMKDTSGPSKDRCLNCGIKFPEHLIQPMVGSGFSLMMCPICALEVSNKMHGLNRNEFNGEIANQYLKEARAYLAARQPSRSHAGGI